MELVAQLEEEGAFNHDAALHNLKVHLQAVAQFEKIGNDDKTVKHLRGLKDLLEYQYKEKQISETVYETLMNGTEELLNQFE